MASKYKFRTIEEMEQFYYGYGADVIQKADAPMISTTTGVYNAIYGKKVWSFLNQEANAFSVLKKVPWDKSGWRVMTARAASSGGGVAESATTLPATIKPTYAEISTKPKVVAHTFDSSELQQGLASSDDGIGFDQLKEDMGTHHAEMMNIMLLADNGTTASNNLESIDRVIATADEQDSCTEYDGSTSYSTGDLDIYSQDRDTATTCDSNVLHNSGSLRAFSTDLVNELIQNVLTYAPAGTSLSDYFFLTGYDTLRQWSQAEESKDRYFGTKYVELSVEGVKTVAGQGKGSMVNAYMDIPIICSKNVVVDQTASDGVSRIYLINKNYLFLKVMKPTQYFEAGISSGNPWSIDRIGDEGMYRTSAELICNCFKAHGKIRDLSKA